MIQNWEDNQEWEKHWHGDCVNSYWEETKQIVYANRLGLKAEGIYGKYPVFDLQNKSILDIGGGPYSILLKCINFSNATVSDPCDYPDWISARYAIKKIRHVKMKGEDYSPSNCFDEVWIYNVLQHVYNPEQIVKNALKAGKIVRLFEWIDAGVSDGHPNDLKENDLNRWLNGIGKVEDMHESGCYGRAYYGIFKGNFYGA